MTTFHRFSLAAFAIFAVAILAGCDNEQVAAPSVAGATFRSQPGQPHLRWVREFDGDVANRCVAFDGSGNLIVAGVFVGTVDFGGGPVSTKPGSVAFDVFLAKYDSRGSFQWVRTFDDDSELKALAADATDHVYLVDGHRLLTAFTANGASSWSVPGCDAVTATPTGEVVVAGGELGLGVGANPFTLKKYTSTGVLLWTRDFAFAEPDVRGSFNGAPAFSIDGATANSIAVAESGNIGVTGVFLGEITFGGNPLVAGNFEDCFKCSYTAFAAVFNANGAHIWSRGFGQDDTYSLGYGISFDRSGNALLTGRVDVSERVAHLPLRLFVVKLGPQGELLWRQYLPDQGQMYLWPTNGIAVTRSGDAIVTGKSQVSAFDQSGSPAWSILLPAGNTYVPVVRDHALAVIGFVPESQNSVLNLYQMNNASR